jgi:hypothetical protein
MCGTGPSVISLNGRDSSLFFSRGSTVLEGP